MQENLQSGQQANALPTNEPQGIGGWLILVVIGLIITPIRLLISIFSDIVPALHSPWAASSVGITFLIYFELVINLLFAVVAILLLILMFNRYRFFPILMVIFYLSNFVFVLLDFILAYQIPLIRENKLDEGSARELMRSLIAVIIWVPYFLTSKRVKNTFTITSF